MMGTLFFRFATNSVFWRRRCRCHRISNFACLLAVTTTFIIRDFSIIAGAGAAAYSPSPSVGGGSSSIHNKQKHQSPTTSTAATAAQTNKPKLFAYQHILPPLEKHEFKIDSDSDSSSSDSSESSSYHDYDYSQSIPCLYTNNIGSASQWVDEHIYNNCKMAKKTTNMNNINMMSSTKSGDDVEGVEEQQQQQIQQPIILGWDMESSPYLPWREYNENSYIGPATLQLSTITNTLVFQIAQDGGGDGRRRRVRPSPLPKFINNLLENSNIIKTGVAIDDDFIELYRWVISMQQQQQQQEDDDGNNNTITTIPKWASGSSSSSSSSASVLRRFDMGKISTTSTALTKGNQISLGKLVQNILGVKILKSNKLARSPWGRAPLEKEEVTYAARDAWAAAAIMHKLNILNENQFSPKSIIKTLNLYNNIQCNINDISTNQAKRKNLKNEWKELKEYNNNKRNNNNSNNNNNKMMNSSSGGVCNNDSSTEEDNEDSENEDKDEDEIRELILWNEMKKLAPKSPIEYDISSLPNLFRIE
jgi:hypothetical protein